MIPHTQYTQLREDSCCQKISVFLCKSIATSIGAIAGAAVSLQLVGNAKICQDVAEYCMDKMLMEVGPDREEAIAIVGVSSIISCGSLVLVAGAIAGSVATCFLVNSVSKRILHKQD